MYSFCSLTGVTERSKILQLFPIKMIGRAQDWIQVMPNKTITTWVELEKLFLERFYYVNNFVDQMAHITKFNQGNT